MTEVTVELWSRHRETELEIMLTSLINQSFTDWDLVILEEFDCNYLRNTRLKSILKLIKQLGHKLVYLKPDQYAGISKSAIMVMNEIETPYSFRITDDIILPHNTLQTLYHELKGHEALAVGTVRSPINDEEMVELEKLPKLFNRWQTVNNKLYWNDYQKQPFIYPRQIIEVDFLFTPYLYDFEKVKNTGFVDNYLDWGYTERGFRLDAEMLNNVKRDYPKNKILLDAGITVYHFNAAQGGARPIHARMRDSDIITYMIRWKDKHELEIKEDG